MAARRGEVEDAVGGGALACGSQVVSSWEQEGEGSLVVAAGAWLPCDEASPCIVGGARVLPA